MGLVITGLLVFFFGQLFAYLQKSTENKKDGITNGYNIVILTIALVGIIVTFIDSCSTKNQRDDAQTALNKVNDSLQSMQKIQLDTSKNILAKQYSIIQSQAIQIEKADSILTLSTTVIEKQRIEFDAIGESLEQSIKIIKLSQKLKKAQQDLIDYQSGKDSYCYLILGHKMPNSNSYQFMMRAFGKNPMDNVEARIVDVYSKNTKNMGTVLNLGKIYPIKNWGHFVQALYSPVIKDKIWLNIFFETGSRTFVQEQKQILINGKWIESVTVSDDDKILYEKIDKDFPKDFK